MDGWVGAVGGCVLVGRWMHLHAASNPHPMRVRTWPAADARGATLTVKEAEAAFVALSVHVQATLVRPMGKSVPDVREQESCTRT